MGNSRNQFKQWTKEEVIKAIQGFYEINGRTPNTNEFVNKNGLPSLTYTRNTFGCTKLGDIFDICDLIKSDPSYKINKEWSLVKLKEHYDLLGKIPTREEFRINKLEPSHTYYCKNFESYENACYLAGIAEIPLTDEERIEISIKELIKLADKLNKCPTVVEYDTLTHRGFGRRVLETKVKIKYNDICRKYIPQYDLNSIHGEVTKEDLTNELTRIYNILNRPPMFIELEEYGCKYSWNLFTRVFDGITYNQVIEGLNWIPSGSTSMVRTEEEMLTDFNNLFLKLKRIPYHSDMNNNSDIASAPTYISHFGSIENICKLLDIDYKKYYKGGGAGKICFDKNGEKCKSLEECNISNFFIDNELIFVRQPKYKELIEDSKKVFDWKVLINNQWRYVEYAGMYSDKPRGGIGRKYKERLEDKIEILRLNGHLDKCLFIYPDDVKTKTLKEIFKPFLGIELKHVENTYNISTRECFSMTDEELLEVLMPYSNNQDVLPSTMIISRKESGIYHEIIKRYGKYSNFAKHFKKKIISNNIDHQASI